MVLRFIVVIDTDRRHGVLLQACLKAFWLLARDTVQTTLLHKPRLMYNLGPFEVYNLHGAYSSCCVA